MLNKGTLIIGQKSRQIYEIISVHGETYRCRVIADTKFPQKEVFGTTAEVSKLRAIPLPYQIGDDIEVKNKFGTIYKVGIVDLRGTKFHCTHNCMFDLDYLDKHFIGFLKTQNFKI